MGRGTWVDISYVKSSSETKGYTCTIRCSHAPELERFSRAGWYLEVWQNYTRLEPLRSQGQGVLYQCDLQMGDELSIDGFAVPSGEFGPRARLVIESGGPRLLFLSPGQPIAIALRPEAEGVLAA